MSEYYKKRVGFIIGCILLFIAVLYLGYYGLIVRFGEPELTTTQLFNKYFFNYLLGLIMGIAGYSFYTVNSDYEDYEE